MSGPAQGNPRPFELSALVECITSVKQYIESDGKDRASSRYISSGALDELVNTVLISSYSEIERDAIGEFLLELVDLVCFNLAKPDRLLPGSLLFARLFLCDSICNYFLNTYGAVSHRSSDAAAVNGNAASVPPGGASKYFVSMFNRLHDGGGLDSINQRLQALVDSDDAGGPSDEDLDDVSLFVQAVYEARFVLTRKWATSTWQHFSALILSVTDRSSVTVTPASESVAQSLYRLDVVGRFLSRAYFTPWTWDCNSDMATTYHMNHSLSLLADEDTSIVVKGAAFLHNFLGWVLSQQYFKKLEPTWAVSDWLVQNCVEEALSAAALDPSLTTAQHTAVLAGEATVRLYHDKIPARPLPDPPVRKRVRVYLKTLPGMPSYGSLLLDLDANTATVQEVYEYTAALLGHAVSDIHLQTQSGKHVMYDAHGEWAIAAVTQTCSLDLLLSKAVPEPSSTGRAASSDVPVASPKAVRISGVTSVGKFGTPGPQELRGLMASLGHDATDTAALQSIVTKHKPVVKSSGALSYSRTRVGNNGEY